MQKTIVHRVTGLGRVIDSTEFSCDKEAERFAYDCGCPVFIEYADGCEEFEDDE